MIKLEDVVWEPAGGKSTEFLVWAEKVRRSTDGMVIDRANMREIREFKETVQRETERIVKTKYAISLFLGFAHYLKNKDIWPTT